ncbi:hypothetical protein [Kocuria sp. CH-021]|uniref:hypothetical protein n=1 Tax=Kocuria sp. CH-021 TaxID=3406735 RepID=UPI003C75798E
MIVVLLTPLFAVLALPHALPEGLGREAIISILFGATLSLSYYDDTLWGATGPGMLPSATIAVIAAGVATGHICRLALISENSWS